MTIAADIASPRGFSRRQALKVVAASAAIPLGVAGYRLLGPQARFFTWNGEALGATSSMMIWHSNAGFAERTINAMVAEVDRLENVFSLFRPNSELSRLNRDGRISDASPDLVSVLTTSRNMGQLSNGAFDPTVQPLWNLFQSYFSVPGADPMSGPPQAEVDAARGLVNFRNVDIDNRSIGYVNPGMQVTLDGIAQGYITDYVADILRNEGFDHVVVELGETRVLGDHPDGRPWRVGVRDQTGDTGRIIELENQASAVSGGYGTIFEPSGRNHHIFDPSTGRSANGMIDVCVISDRATNADALGKAIFVGGETHVPALLAAYPGTRASVTRLDGSRGEFQ